ncbi:polo-like kinase 3 [Mortierella sp. 14UC]|nr:polo-like kinase 3 [Mortierella sp. 14UC]
MPKNTLYGATKKTAMDLFYGPSDYDDDSDNDNDGNSDRSSDNDGCSAGESGGENDDYDGDKANITGGGQTKEKDGNERIYIHPGGYDKVLQGIDKEERRCSRSGRPARKSVANSTPNIIKPIAEFNDAGTPVAVMELCSPDTLGDLLLARGCLKEWEDLQLVIGDLGLVEDKNNGQKFGSTGTLEYQAPELATDNAHTSALDMWSVGCIFPKMLGYKSGVFPKYYPSLTKEANDLLERTLDTDPESRISAVDLKAHYFLARGLLPREVTWDIIKQAMIPKSSETEKQDSEASCTAVQGEDEKKKYMKTKEEEEEEEEEEEKEKDQAGSDAESVDLDDVFNEVEAAKAEKEKAAALAEEAKEIEEQEDQEEGNEEASADLDDFDELDAVFNQVEAVKATTAAKAEEKDNEEKMKKAHDEVSNDDSEDKMARKKRKLAKEKAREKAREKKALEESEDGQGSDLSGWPTHLLNL